MLDLSYYDALRGMQIPAHDPELLSREIADRLPAQTPVRFMASPFTTDPAQLKRLLIHFEREKLIQRHDFSCLVFGEQLTPESLHLFSQLNFSELIMPLPGAPFDKDHWLRVFRLCRSYRMKVQLIMSPASQELDVKALHQIHEFLRAQMGYFTVAYTEGHFVQPEVDRAFIRLGKASKEVERGQLGDAYLNETFYQGTYQFMQLKFASRVKTVLEINPFAEQTFYRDYNRVPLPWDVTLSTIRDGDLDQAQLKGIHKTFDAIVLFQGLTRLRDPRAAILQLQRYARPTTQWICVQFNLAAFPSLALLLENQLHNPMPLYTYWPHLKLQSQQSLQNLFAGTDIEFEWVPTEMPLPEIERMTQLLDPHLRTEFGNRWEAFKEQSRTLLWTAHGEVGLTPSEDGFVEGFAEDVVEGFI